MIPSTVDRVPQNTAESVNEEIRRRTDQSGAQHKAAGSAAIRRRLRELDDEWDIERVLEANAASIALVGLALAGGADRRWLMLPATVAAFLLQHALQGWCPPVPVFRRLGYRTAAEIHRERYALKALRGDFDRVSEAEDRAGAALGAARA